MRTTTPNGTLDLRGKSITTFIVHETAARLRDVAEGDTIEVVTDAAEPIERDIAAWSGATPHELLDVSREAEGQRFVIRKGPARPTGRKLAMVISKPGLLELLSPLAFALAAALEGIEVHVYFQGPAVRVLKRGFKGTLPGWGRPFSAFARRGLAKAGHIAPQHKLGQLRDLGARLYMCGGSMEHFKVRKEDLIFDDLPIVAYLTFMTVMDEADIHVFLQ